MNFLVVGAGVSGATCARVIAEAGYKVTVIDCKNHVGGRVYDEYDDYGILVQRYGPHIFHTPNKEVWNFVERFSEWEDFDHQPTAMINGVENVQPFNLETIDTMWDKKKARHLRKALKVRYEGMAPAVLVALRLGEKIVSEVQDND